MFGLNFIKIPPTTYLLQYRGGKVVREGAGLSFFYYAPTTTLVGVPLGTADAPFIFEEVTADFQAVTMQGQVTYRIVDAKKIASLLNFTLGPNGVGYTTDDPKKLTFRIVNAVQVLAQKEFKALKLRDATRAADAIAASIRGSLGSSPELQALGIEVIGLSVLAIKPTPETARALEAEAREQLLREADEAIYRRRNAAVEQERAIKENELNTEVAVENKKRQIREAQMDAERAVQEKQHELQRIEMAARTDLEEKNKALVTLATENARAQADAKAYAMQAMMKALAGVDPRVLQTITATEMKPDQLIASAFQELAERADKIGELNISPELLHELLGKRK